MIDYKKSAEINNCIVDELKNRFERFPKSNKRIVVVCENCGLERESYFYAYRDLCSKCVNNTPESIEANRLRGIEQYLTQSAKDDQSVRMKNSVAHKAIIESQKCGHDIVNHHWLYDDSDLSKYTMKMTRSGHTTMHNRMRADGYEVQHINSDTDDNGLWGYK